MTIILETSKSELRRWLRGPQGNDSVVTNVIRLCARRSYTLPELSELSIDESMGLPRDNWGTLSDLNLTVAMGEFRDRNLLVDVGESMDRAVRGGAHFRWRASFLAFLVCPELALLEPSAYFSYLSALFAQPLAKERFFEQLMAEKAIFLPREKELLYEWQKNLLLAFPSLLEYCFAVYSEQEKLETSQETTKAERQRIFGNYYIAGLSVDGERNSRAWGRNAYHLLRGRRFSIPRHFKELQYFFQKHESTLMPIFARVNHPIIGGLMERVISTKLCGLNHRIGLKKYKDNTLDIEPVEQKALLLARLCPVPFKMLF
jgi:hypothetical protein